MILDVSLRRRSSASQRDHRNTEANLLEMAGVGRRNKPRELLCVNWMAAEFHGMLERAIDQSVAIIGFIDLHLRAVAANAQLNAADCVLETLLIFTNICDGADGFGPNC